MRKQFATLLLFVAFAITQAFGVVEANPANRIHAALQEITVEAVNSGDPGNCTAYAVGPHAILTAEHCFEGTTVPTMVLITFAGEKEPRPIAAILPDGSDHTLVIFTEKTFSSWLALKFSSVPQQGERVFTWGNPTSLYGAVDCYREGYYSGHMMLIGKKSEAVELHLFVFPAVPGDSGSLIFNQRGEIVGMVSRGHEGFAGSYNFAFTPQQLARAQR